MIVSEIFAIQDCHYYNDGTKTTGLIIDSGVSCTVENDYLKITTSSNGAKYVTIPLNNLGNSDWLFECEIAKEGTTQHYASYIDNYYYVVNTENGGLLVSNSPAYTTKSQAVSVGGIVSWEYSNGVLKTKYNNTDFTSNTISLNNPVLKFMTNQNRIQYIKNIKVKPL